MISRARIRVCWIRRALRKKAPVPRGSEKKCACGRQIRTGIQVFGDADRMPDYHGISVVVGINVDAPHQLDELACFSPVVAACLIEVLANEVEGHF